MSKEHRTERRVLLFDVLNTLVHDPFYEEMPEFFGMTLQELIPHLHPSSWVEFELGAIDEHTHLGRFFADGRRFDFAGFKERVRRAYRWLEGMEELLRELREGGAEMHVLSNYPPWYAMIEERLRVSRYLPWTFVSCEHGVRKPDPEFFRLAASRLGVAPSDCVLIDDREINCRSAESIGMTAILRQDTPGVRCALRRLGLLDDDEV